QQIKDQRINELFQNDGHLYFNVLRKQRRNSVCVCVCVCVCVLSAVCCCVCVCGCVCVCLQTELTDCISMLVGNNGRIQGIISQLEESCRAVEVRSMCVCVCECFKWVLLSL